MNPRGPARIPSLKAHRSFANSPPQHLAKPMSLAVRSASRRNASSSQASRATNHLARAFPLAGRLRERSQLRRRLREGCARLVRRGFLARGDIGESSPSDRCLRDVRVEGNFSRARLRDVFVKRSPCVCATLLQRASGCWVTPVLTETRCRIEERVPSFEETRLNRYNRCSCRRTNSPGAWCNCHCHRYRATRTNTRWPKVRY